MESKPGRANRRPIVYVIIALALALVLVCAYLSFFRPPPPTAPQIALCAVDSPQSDCAPGDFRALQQLQIIVVRAVDNDGKTALKNKTIVLTIKHESTHPAVPASSVAGCATTFNQPQTVSTNLTTDSNGMAPYAYCSIQRGTDTISAQFSSSPMASPAPRPAVVHWIAPPPTPVVHPIIFLHGLDENANDYANTITGGLGTKEWTTVFEALEIPYDKNYIEAFCYLDDQAYPTSNCPAPEPSTCTVTPSCTSQGSIDADAVELADTVIALYNRAKSDPRAPAPFPARRVTLMGYSMGAAITRTMIAGCPNSPTNDLDGDADNDCMEATGMVDQAFFLNGAQQGSWLLTIDQSLNPSDPSGLAGTDLLGGSGSGGPVAPIFTSLSPFFSVTPLLQLAIHALVYKAFKAFMLDPTSDAVRDLTPLSDNINARNAVGLDSGPPSGITFYNFYGAIQVTFSTTLLVYHVPGKKVLPLGDLVLLPQDDRVTATPVWGGAAFCDEGHCQPPSPGGSSDKALYYSADGSGRYHEWALVDLHPVNVDLVAPLLSAPDDVSSLKGVVSSPVWHLGIFAPGVTAPGGSDATRVYDETGQEPGRTTDMPTEILDILMKADGLP